MSLRAQAAKSIETGRDAGGRGKRTADLGRHFAGRKRGGGRRIHRGRSASQLLGRGERGGSLLPLTIGAPEAGEVRETADSDAPEVLDLSGLDIQDALIWDEGDRGDAGLGRGAGGPQTGERNGRAPRAAGGELLGHEPGRIRPDRPDHQKAIWELMMQPITVMDVGQTEHVYPTFTPGADKRSPMSRTARASCMEQSQGVHVLEEDTDGDGYVLIEALCQRRHEDGQRIHGIPEREKGAGLRQKSILFEVKPSDKYALLVDKLRQKLYIFEAGAIIGGVDVSTGAQQRETAVQRIPGGRIHHGETRSATSTQAAGRSGPVRPSTSTAARCSTGAATRRRTARASTQYEAQLGMSQPQVHPHQRRERAGAEHAVAVEQPRKQDEGADLGRSGAADVRAGAAGRRLAALPQPEGRKQLPRGRELPPA